MRYKGVKIGRRSRVSFARRLTIFAQCQFDEAACELGLKRLRHYRKEWDEERGVWKDRPRHDDASHGADGFLTFASAGFTPPKPHLAPRRDMSWVV